ncbi:SCO family protein [Oceanospirillum beijerinckii]|uniref:SCO family protein n=1 Tax=Oceanospirillum beijerinckii TaxID=64976 RepID=UPI00068822B3|nr:SCO family protein [Oceanospirillum beijerinckii]
MPIKPVDTLDLPQKRLGKLFVGLLLWLVLIAIIFSIPFLPLLSERAVATNFLPDKGSNQAIVLFGFSGCSTVCSTQLTVLREVLNNKAYPEQWPHVVFIDIDQLSSTEQVTQYVSGFDHRFTGYFPSPQELTTLKDLFGLNFQQQGSQIIHSGKVFFLQRNEGWKITSAYNAQAFNNKKLISFLN